MIKCFMYIIFIISLENVILQISDTCIGQGSSAKDCSSRLTENEKNDGAYCCLFTGTTKDTNYETNQCMKLNEDEYHNIKQKIKDKENNYENPSIDCKSYYLHISIIIILLFLL